MARIEVDDDNPIFKHEVAGITYSFTMIDVAADRRQWMADIIGRQMNEIAAIAARSAKETALKAVRDAIGI